MQTRPPLNGGQSPGLNKNCRTRGESDGFISIWVWPMGHKNSYERLTAPTGNIVTTKQFDISLGSLFAAGVLTIANSGAN